MSLKMGHGRAELNNYFWLGRVLGGSLFCCYTISQNITRLQEEEHAKDLSWCLWNRDSQVKCVGRRREVDV